MGVPLLYSCQPVFVYVATVQPSVSGLLDFDYPSLADPKIGLGSMKELGDVRRVPLPVELVEQFGRILVAVVITMFNWISFRT